MNYKPLLKKYGEQQGIPISDKVLDLLTSYDPKELYSSENDSIKPMSEVMQQIEVGKTSNLIKRMVAQNAPNSEVVLAFRHLLALIDSRKHHLDYKKSEADNDIPNLRTKYPFQSQYNNKEEPK